MAGIFILWAIASPRDRMSLRIVLLATLGSWLLTEGITVHIIAPWKLIFPGAVETATILALLKYSPNRTGYMQAGLLFIAWLAHLFCYLDVMLDTNFVYDRYSQLIGVVAIGQILAFYDTLTLNLRRLGHWCSKIRGHCSGVIRPASVSPVVLPDTGR